MGRFVCRWRTAKKKKEEEEEEEEGEERRENEKGPKILKGNDQVSVIWKKKGEW